jgi:homoserine kinase
VHVRVPATSANLGPGFDSLGLALGLSDDLMVRITDDGISVDVAGEGADEVQRNAKHLVVRAMQATFALLGGQPRGIELNCANRIPHGRGLGSSAAAICAGIVAARALTLGGEQTLGDQAAFALANELEGHPDNVAACMFGGFTLAWTPSREGAAVACVRLEPAAEVVPVVFVPPGQLATTKARRLLPETVPHADAAANAGRAALLVEALTHRPDLLLDATEDRLHQGYRAPAMKRTAALVDKLRAAGIAAVVSGAGPSVLALTVADGAERAQAMTPAGWSARTPGMSQLGAHVVTG